MGQCYSNCYSNNGQYPLQRDLKGHKKNKLTHTSLYTDCGLMTQPGYYPQSRKASAHQNSLDIDLEGYYNLNNSNVVDSLHSATKSFLKLGKSTAINTSKVCQQQLHTRNKALFLKDYSKDEVQPSFLEIKSSKPKLHALIEQKDYYVKHKTSINEKKQIVQMKHDLLKNGNQQLVMIGNKVTRIDQPIDCDKYAKLIIEVQSVQMHPNLSRKDFPIITVSQPQSSVPDEFKSLAFINSSNVLAINQDSFVQQDGSNRTETSLSMAKKDQANTLMYENALLKLQGGESNKKPAPQIKHNFQTFIEKTNSKGSFLTDNLNTPKQKRQNISKGQNLFELENEELIYTSRKPNLVETKQQKRRARKTTEFEFQTYQYYEGFVLYYDKSAKVDQQDKCFSIELNIQAGYQRTQVGKRQTFMLGQFMNGSIYEKQLQFGSDNSSSIDLDLQKKKDFSAKTFLKIQFIPNENEKLLEAKWHLQQKLDHIDEKLLQIDNTIQSHFNKDHRSLSLNEATPQSKATAIESKDHHNFSSSKKSFSRNEDPGDSQKSFSYLVMNDRISLREQHQSQAAGFFQCQLLFMEQNYETPKRQAETENVYQDIDVLENVDDYKAYSETQPNLVEKEDENILLQ